MNKRCISHIRSKSCPTITGLLACSYLLNLHIAYQMQSLLPSRRLGLQLVLGGLGAFFANHPAFAQQPTTPPTAVYTHVQQPPQLSGTTDPKAISTAVQQVLIYPKKAVREGLAGKVFVDVTVAPDGTVYATKVVRGLRPDFDSAAVAAVKLLPRLSPARTGGRAVYYKFTQPVSFQPPTPSATH
jgi:TonB family protein